MTWETVRLQPGLNIEITETQNVAGYSFTAFGRFKAGLFQKMGGWSRFTPLLVNGVPSAIHSWQDLSGTKRLAVGSSTGISTISNGSMLNVSPQTLTSDTTVDFATTSGSPIVNIVDTNIANVTAYDSVFFATPVSVGGLILSGVYQIYANIAADEYQIIAGANATATVASPGGTVPTFNTTSGSANITVTLEDHGMLAGDDIIFPVATTVGGVTIEGRYTVQSVSSADAFVITTSTQASSTAGPTAMNSGNARLVYHIAIGPQAAGGGYGVGLYGAGVYGKGNPISGQLGTDLGASDWSLDNWGEFLVMSPQDGGVYYWGPASGFVNASLVSSAPIYNSGIFVSTSQQMIIAYGSTQQAAIGVYQDPLLVRWCDVEDFFDWNIADPTNQAGQFRLSSGSEIIGGGSTQQRNLLWTDKDLWVSSYIGSALVFNAVKVGEGAGLIAKHAWGKLSETVYWIGKKNIFAYDSAGSRIVQCPVWDAIFQDMDLNNTHLVHVGVNKAHSEIMFYWPSASASAGYCDKMAKMNVVENTWDISDLPRTAWKDSDTFDYPIATTRDGAIYNHEYGLDADGAAMTPSFETGYFFVDNGREKVFIDRVYPDFKWGQRNGSQNADIQITIMAIDEMGDTPTEYGPFTVNASTPMIEPRVRGRQIALRVSSADTGSFWRLGAVRFRVAPDGRSGRSGA